MTGQTVIQIGTVYNFSQASQSTSNYQITFQYPGQITLHITGWTSTYNWTTDYDRLYVYNDTSAPIDRNGFSSEADPFLFHMFQNNSELVFNIGQAGVYTISIHSGVLPPSQSQNYQLSVTSVNCNDIYEPNDNMQQATSIAIGSTTSAYQWRKIKTAAVGGDEDWYRISIDSPGQLKLVLNNWIAVYDWGNDYDRLYVYNGKGDPIGGGIDIGSSGSDPFFDHMMGDSNHTKTMNLSHAGTYYLRLHSGSAYSSTLTPYTIKPTFTPAFDQFEPNNDFADAKIIPAADTFYNAYEWRCVDSSMNVSGDEDYYYFMAANAGQYSFTLLNWIGIYDWGTDYDWMVVYAADSSIVGPNPLDWMMGSGSPVNFNVPSPGKYYIRLHCGGTYSLGGYSFKLSGNLTGVKETTIVPKEFALEQNYPNPFNPDTKIKYELPAKGFVTIKVFDVLGKELVTLVNEDKNPGNYVVTFNGSGFSSGVYFYQLKSGSFIETKKFLLLK
jgi:hypothetical protein